jgi:site-specific recombinase XerD
MLYLHPVLLAWSGRYGHLHEVTRGDVTAVLAGLRGSRRANVLVALRSLFGFCKKHKTIFRSPVQGIRVGQHPYGIIQPLSQDEVDQAAKGAATPAARLVLVLAAMHAARPKAIRELLLDDVDLGNHRLTIGGRTRPLDDLTRQVLAEWLSHRRARWPSTANPHPLVNQMNANGTGPRQHHLLRQDRTARAGCHAGTAPRRPAAPGSNRQWPRPAAPGRDVRPRPQDRDPLRRKRPPATHHSRRGTRPRLFR